MAHLDRLEADISDGETEVLTGAHEAYLDRIIAWRQELLRLKRYYEQLDSIFDELAENDNGLLGKQNTRRFANLGKEPKEYKIREVRKHILFQNIRHLHRSGPPCSLFFTGSRASFLAISLNFDSWERRDGLFSRFTVFCVYFLKAASMASAACGSLSE